MAAASADTAGSEEQVEPEVPALAAEKPSADTVGQELQLELEVLA